MLSTLANIGRSALSVHLTPLLPRERLLRGCERRVIATVRAAMRDVPYYGERYRRLGIDPGDFRTLADLKRLPVLTKDEVRAHYPDGLVARGVERARCHTSATTGSTGKALPFLFSRETFAYYQATSLRVYTMIGYRPWHRATYIKYTAVPFPRLGPFFRIQHIPSTSRVEEQIRLLVDSRPDLLVGYASIIAEIARRITPALRAQLRLRFISMNSELSSEAERELVSSVFQCPVYDEYSTEETWMIASQCRHHRYHLFVDNVWVEILDDQGRDCPPGQIGEIFLTTTRSPAMPFIRYRIGDLGQWGEGSCPCGSPLPLVESIEGRADDSFVLPDGTYVSSLKILNTFTRFIKKYLHLLEEFRVVQLEADRIEIELVRGPDYRPEQMDELILSLREIVGSGVHIGIRPVPRIDSGGQIKRKAIESRVTRR